MSIEGVDEDFSPFATLQYPDSESAENKKSLTSLAREILSEEEGIYSPEEILQAKACSEYQELADLCEKGINNPDSSSIEALSQEMERQKKDATINKDQASALLHPTPERGYNLAQEMVNLFLDKEKELDQIIRGKGKDLTELNEISKHCNHYKNLLLQKERVLKELKEASKSDKPEIQEQLEKIKDAIAESREKLNGRKIKMVQSFFGISKETTIELPDTDDIKELKESISGYMDEVKLRIKQGFSSLQEDFTTKMACFESTKNALKHFEESVSKIVRNQRPNG